MMLSVLQFLFLLVVSVAALIWTIVRSRRLSSRAKKGRESFLISRAGPAKEMLSFFSRYLRSGATMVVPAGDGGYPKRIAKSKSVEWFKAIHELMGRGVTIEVLVTIPSAQALSTWKHLVDEGGDRFRLYLFNRDKVDDGLKIEIERLDTFHPVLLYTTADGAPSPLAMWVENYHPVGEAEAHEIEAIGTSDIPEDDRFEKFYSIIEMIKRSPASTLVTRTNFSELTGAYNH